MRQIVKRNSPVVGALIAVFVITIVLRQFHSGPSAAPDFPSGVNGAPVIVTISNGESGSDIATNLFSLKVVKSADAFFRVAVADPRSSRIAPGDHLLDRSIPAKEALEQLLDKDRIQGLIEIADGARLAEVITSLVSVGYTKADIDKAMKSLALPLHVRSGNPEGFLYPAHYSFARGTSVQQVFEKMVGTFIDQTKNLDFSQSVEGFTGYQLLIIASLIQAEADPQDYGKVSRTIYNRLRINMPLQLDTTVQYLLKRRGEITLAIKDTKIKSAYNTYQHYGLPPGPIGSPSIAALKAALTPEIGDWIYFITVAPGDTRFTKSHCEFLAWKREYQKNVKAGLFKVKP